MVWGIFSRIAGSTEVEGGGLKLFGQCPYRTNTFKKGASLTKEYFWFSAVRPSLSWVNPSLIWLVAPCDPGQGMKKVVQRVRKQRARFTTQLVGNYWWSIEETFSCIILNFCLRSYHFWANHTTVESVLWISISWIEFHPLDIAMDWRWCCDDLSTSIRKSTWRVALANGVRFQLRVRLQFLILLQIRFQLR